MREVKLPTGIVCKFDKKDNLISVISPHDQHHLPVKLTIFGCFYYKLKNYLIIK